MAMYAIEKHEIIEQRLNSIEKHVDSFHDSLKKYKDILVQHPRHDIPVLLQPLDSPEDSDPKEEPSFLFSENAPPPEGSLFDDLIQDYIREKDFEIKSGSDDEISYRIILENTRDPIVEMDPTGKIHFINPAFSRTFNFSETELKGSSFFNFVPPEYHLGIREGIEYACFENFGNYQDSKEDIQVFRAHTKNRFQKSLEGIFYAYMLDEKPILILKIRDLTFNDSLAKELQEVKDNYNALSETISETIIRLDENFKIIFVNSAVLKTFGYQKNEIKGKSFSTLFPRGVFERNRNSFRKYFLVDDQHRRTLGLDITIEALGQSKNRGLFPMEISFGNSKQFEGRTMTCILRDITKRKHSERKLRHLAFHDKLTGLGNRDLFNTDLMNHFKILEQYPNVYSALMFLDLDGFKQVNDTLGHNFGDLLLVETGRRLRSTLRETGSVFRFGGDEFVVLLKSINNRDDVAMVGEKILQVVGETYHLREKTTTTSVNVGVSIGIALIPENGKNSEIVTRNADLAMYSAKDAGKNTYAFYNNDMNRQMVERWELEQGLKKGISDGSFILHYQPLVDKTGKIVGAESLIRWQHPEQGIISPFRFIPIAEETGLIIPLGKWILETACRQVRELNDKGFHDIFIAVNISPRQFEHPDFLSITKNCIEKSVIDPCSLKLELTETSIMNTPEATIAKMRALKENHPGIQISIDDFGTGYSSLSYLSQLPADTIKIDLSFVTNLHQKTNQKIVNAIINLANSLELKVVVEGVETQKQVDYFLSRECHYLQGYFYSRPVPLESLIDSLTRQENSEN